MIHTTAALLPWLDPATIITNSQPWALLVVCFIIFAETGLLIGFLLPGDTLLIMAGLLSHSTPAAPNGVFGINAWWVALAIGVAAFVGGEVGYFIGHKAGPSIFERKDSGIFSRKNVERTNAFFERFGGLTVILARFVPVVRTFAPIAAGVGHMPWRKYTLYNFIGAVIWGIGLTMLGSAVGYLPFSRDMGPESVDVLLLAALAGTGLSSAIHYFRERAAAKREGAVTPAEAEALTLDPKTLEDGDQPTR